MRLIRGKTREVAEGADGRPCRTPKTGFAHVFDHFQFIFFRDAHDRVHVARQSNVWTEWSPAFFSLSLLDISGTMNIIRVHIDKYRRETIVQRIFTSATKFTAGIMTSSPSAIYIFLWASEAHLEALGRCCKRRRTVCPCNRGDSFSNCWIMGPRWSDSKPTPFWRNSFGARSNDKNPPGILGRPRFETRVSR